MKRRGFIKHVGIGISSSVLLKACYQSNKKRAPSEPPKILDENITLLSSQGSSRATGYYNAPKSITFQNKTWVTWMDSISEGFWIQIAEFDKTKNVWSSVYTVGEAYDNHGGAALTIDSEGYLHIVFGPHARPFKYRKTTRPYDASEWREEVEFGSYCTYPTLLCGLDNTLYVTCRKDFIMWGPTAPCSTELWTKKPNAEWTHCNTLLYSKYTGYVFFGESLCWGTDNKTLHLCCNIHEKTNRNLYGRLQTIGYMVSYDYGKTWYNSAKIPIKTPITAENIEVLYAGGLDKSTVVAVGTIAINAQDIPHIVYCVQFVDTNTSTLILTVSDGLGGWKNINLTDYLPVKLKSWQLIDCAGITFNNKGQISIVATIQNIKKEERDARAFIAWGHPSNEVVCFQAKDINSPFIFKKISQFDDKTPNWLPNLERHLGFNEVSESHTVIYTSGVPAKNNNATTSNKVFFTSI